MNKSVVQMGDVVSNAPVIETGAESGSAPVVDNAQTTTTEAPQSEAPMSRHQRAMKDILAKRETVRDGELQYGETLANDARARAGLEAENLMTGTEPGQVTEQEVRQVVNDQPQTNPQTVTQTAPQTQQQPSQQQVPNETLVRVNINGTILEIPQHELDSLVADGARARFNAQNAQQQTTQQAPVQQQPTQVQQPAQHTQQIDYDALFTPEDAARTYERISSGSEEDGANAIRELAQNIARAAAANMRQPNVDVAAIERQVVERVRAENVRERNLQTIGEEYPDIFNNPDLGKFAGMKARELAQQYVQAGVQKPTLELWREACNSTRQVLGLHQSPPVTETQQAGVSPSPAVVVARQPVNKETLPRVPTGAGVRSQGQHSAQPQSSADVVNNMRKARGQAPMR